MRRARKANRPTGGHARSSVRSSGAIDSVVFPAGTLVEESGWLMGVVPWGYGLRNVGHVCSRSGTMYHRRAVSKRLLSDISPDAQTRP